MTLNTKLPFRLKTVMWTKLWAILRAVSPPSRPQSRNWNLGGSLRRRGRRSALLGEALARGPCYLGRRRKSLRFPFGAEIPAWILLLFFPACFSRHPHWLPSEAPNLHQTSRCYPPEELSHGHLPLHLMGKAARSARSLPAALVAGLEVGDLAGGRRRRQLQESRCTALQLENVYEAEFHQRSLSPWRYRIDMDENRYPPKLAFAECLCKGCIDMKSGRETSSLNSILLEQRVMVLRRKPCALKGDAQVTPGAFTFQIEYINVPVGCTCVLPRFS
ncbi:interleukin-17C [Sarcophilus harrisii]|uniref:interleukin-17C n=1 Tax=Sarcophilus harrisii TaxID=9305 RepID=UPI00062BDBF4|nr:interleukin-17C [Sarcophilus harrisii]